MRMNQATKPADAPGHDGARYREQIAEGAAPRPAAEADEALILEVAMPETLLEAETEVVPVVVTETVIVIETPAAAQTTSAGDDGTPVVFTPDDVTVPPPDRPPTEDAPGSERVGLIFERS
jgi:hypothetical protein